MFAKTEAFGFATVVLLSAVLWFGMLGYRDLFDPDEGRYAQIPAAMVASGDWLTPRLNDYKYFEKPALQYWATAIIYTVLGKSNMTARLWTALMGFASALFAAFVSYRLYGRRAAFFTYLIVISSIMVVAFGHMLTLDMALSTFVVAGIGCLLIAQSHPPSVVWTRNWMLAAWAALALGTLTKGLVALVLPAATVLIYSVWQRDLNLWKKMHLFKGLLLCALIASPWFIEVSLANPGFAKFFFIHEHLDRYLSQVHKRGGPVYYFIPFLVLGVCPWLFITLKSFVRPGFKWVPDNPGNFNPERFIWTFAVVTFIFFSLGQSKLPGYILPIFPAIAIISGRLLSRREQVGADRWVLGALGLAVLFAAFNLDRLASDRYPLHMWESYSPWLMASGLLFLLAALGMFVLKKRPLIAVTLAALMSLGSIQLIILGFNSLAETRSSRMLAEAITDSLPPGVPVFSFRTFPESAVFYLGAPINIVDYAGELQMGINAEPEKHIKTFEEFEEKWRYLDKAALIVNIETFDNFALYRLPGKVVYRGPKRMVIIKS